MTRTRNLTSDPLNISKLDEIQAVRCSIYTLLSVIKRNSFMYYLTSLLPECGRIDKNLSVAMRMNWEILIIEHKGS